MNRTLAGTRHLVRDLLTTAAAGGATAESRPKLTDTRYAVSSPVAATVAKRQGSACRCSKAVISAVLGRHQSAATASPWHPRGKGAPLGPSGHPAKSPQVGAWSSGWPHGLLQARAKPSQSAVLRCHCTAVCRVDQWRVRQGRSRGEQVQHDEDAAELARAARVGNQPPQEREQHVDQQHAWRPRERGPDTGYATHPEAL